MDDNARAKAEPLPTAKEILLERVRVEGWHGTQRLAHLAERVGQAAYRAAFEAGQQARARGEPCRCIRCWSGEVNV